MKYIHNPGGIGKNYFIGRPISKKQQTVTAYNDDTEVNKRGVSTGKIW